MTEAFLLGSFRLMPMWLVRRLVWRGTLFAIAFALALLLSIVGHAAYIPIRGLALLWRAVEGLLLLLVLRTWEFAVRVGVFIATLSHRASTAADPFLVELIAAGIEILLALILRRIPDTGWLYWALTSDFAIPAWQASAVAVATFHLVALYLDRWKLRCVALIASAIWIGLLCWSALRLGPNVVHTLFVISGACLCGSRSLTHAHGGDHARLG